LATAANVYDILRLLRELPPRDQLRVIAAVLPEVERAFPATLQGVLVPEAAPGGTAPARPRRSLWGICADLGPAPSAADIDAARRDAWASFPRDDI
jgi:hypothetical protein